jgi:hypothetical protein
VTLAGVFMWQGVWAALAALGLVIVLFSLSSSLQESISLAARISLAAQKVSGQ